MSFLAWLRRLVVSAGIGATSYAIMLAIMVLSIIFDREFEPIIKTAVAIGHGTVGVLDGLVSGSHWGQVAANHLRQQVNMTHVVLSIPAIIIATLVIGIPLNKLLGGTRTALQRLAIALTSIPATVVLAVVLFSFNALFPESYNALLRFAYWVWEGSLNLLASTGDTIPGTRKLTNALRQGASGHHYVIMALCSVLASFVINAVFALVVSFRSTRQVQQQVAT